MSTQPILAGVDGSESALDAVRWAAAEAQELRAPLHLITVFGWMPVPELEDPFRSASGAWESLRENAEKTLATAAAEVRRRARDPEIGRSARPMGRCCRCAAPPPPLSVLPPHRERGKAMPTFMIERNVPGASEMTPEQLRELAATSNSVVDSLGVVYTWRHSYVAGDKIYCVHETDDAETVHEHARRGGFPADVVVAVAAVIGPETAG